VNRSLDKKLEMSNIDIFVQLEDSIVNMNRT